MFTPMKAFTDTLFNLFYLNSIDVSDKTTLNDLRCFTACQNMEDQA